MNSNAVATSDRRIADEKVVHDRASSPKLRQPNVTYLLLRKNGLATTFDTQILDHDLRTVLRI